VSRKKTVLVVVAHADDMEFMAGGTVARFVDELGYDVYEYILTDNCKGSYRLSPEELIRVSAREAVEAGKILGLKEVRLEGYADGSLDTAPSHRLRGKIMAMMREVRADIVMSWDPFAPLEDHPDHRSVAMAAFEAAAFCGNPLYYPEHRHPPRPVLEAYWFTKSPMNAEKFVDITAVMDKKIEALLAHDCQMVLTVDMLRQEAETLGADVPILKDLGQDGHRQVIEAGIRLFCSTVGEPHGMTYAEQFRYEKRSTLDVFFGAGLIKTDFE